MSTAGDDRVWAEGGDDVVFGGTGANFLAGGAGNDELFGGGGNDYLMGEAGDDTLEGGTGEDVLAGGAGNDSLLGNAERTTFFGQAGADTFDVVGGVNWVMDFEPGVTGSPRRLLRVRPSSRSPRSRAPIFCSTSVRVAVESGSRGPCCPIWPGSMCSRDD